MTKTDLLGVYRTSLNHIKLTYASLVLWCNPDTPAFFDAMYGQMENIPKPFPELGTFLHDEQAMRIACEELYDSAHRSALNRLLRKSNFHVV